MKLVLTLISFLTMSTNVFATEIDYLCRYGSDHLVFQDDNTIHVVSRHKDVSYAYSKKDYRILESLPERTLVSYTLVSGEKITLEFVGKATSGTGQLTMDGKIIANYKCDRLK